MKLANATAAAAALSLVATPCLAADIPNHEPAGARRSSAVAGAYFRVPFSRDASGRARQAQAGLRLSMQHDYRSADAPTARVVQADGFDLRLTDTGGPTLYAAGRPLTGEEGRRANLTGGGIVVTGLVVAGLVVGFLVLRSELSEGD
jgi:hypothetical protein